MVLNCADNVAVAFRFINQSKGKRKMEEWLRNPANIATDGIDVQLIIANLKKAGEVLNESLKV